MTSCKKMLRDQVVCGVKDERALRRLHAESQLEVKKTIELAIGMKTTDNNTRDLKNGKSPVKRVTKDRPKEFLGCGTRSHDADKCRYTDEECSAINAVTRVTK